MAVSEVHETLLNIGVRTDTVGYLTNWSPKRLFDLLITLRSIPITVAPVPPGPFSFIANDSLSGAAVPLSRGGKRTQKAAQLARFAALYADALLVRSPFERYHGTATAADPDGNLTTIGRDIEPADFENSELRSQFIEDVELTLLLEPLFRAGIAQFAESAMHWCPSCVRVMAERNDLAHPLMAPDELAWQRRVAKMVVHIEDAFLRRGQALLHQHGDHAHATLFLPDGLMEYDSVQHTLVLSKHLAQKARDPIALSRRNARQLGVLASEIDRVIDDISTQNAIANTFGCHYLTDRAIDIELMDIVSNKSARAFNAAALDAMTHMLPFLDGVSVDTVLKVRNDEGESFLVYRDAVRKVLGASAGLGPARLKEALADEIRPELNRIDLLLRTERGRLSKSALGDVLVLLAAVSVASFSGLLPPHLGVPGDLVDVGAALGGWQGAKGLVGTLSRLRAPPKEVTDNRFAFLWKVKQQTNR